MKSVESYDALTLTTSSATRRLWVFYDGECPMCIGLARRFEEPLRAGGFEFATLQTPWVRERLGLEPGEPLTEMKVLTEDGKALGGGDAVAYLAGHITWAYPLHLVAKLPFGRFFLRRAYQWVAANRTCAAGTCALPQRKANSPIWPGWAPLIILPGCAVTPRSQLPAWAWMWILAPSIFAGCKWASWWPHRNTHSTFARHLGYLLFWPGMDPGTFLSTADRPNSPRTSEWIWAAMKTALGAALLWVGVWRVPSTLPLLRGWTALFGLIFLLHFGSFHLLSLAWRAGGVNARPLMRTPALSTSLGEFWGGRWNAGFHELASRFLFKPLRGSLGATGAMFVVFLASGLVHDLVISLPAGSGYGLPTAYFLLQAAGLWFERSSLGMKIGLGRGLPGWLFVLAVAGGPAFWLFHPWFVMRVVIPFMDVVKSV